jgi:hypothetical protein
MTCACVLSSTRESVLPLSYMVFQPGDTEFASEQPIAEEFVGEAEGMRRVLTFAGTWSLGTRTIIAASHEVIFYPKFLCELMYTEYYWAALKKYTRDNCKYLSRTRENGACGDGRGILEDYSTFCGKK